MARKKISNNNVSFVILDFGLSAKKLIRKCLNYAKFNVRNSPNELHMYLSFGQTLAIAINFSHNWARQMHGKLIFLGFYNSLPIHDINKALAGNKFRRQIFGAVGNKLSFNIGK